MVLNVFDEHKSKEENIRAMEAKIEEVGPFKVSHHCGRSDSIRGLRCLYYQYQKFGSFHKWT